MAIPQPQTTQQQMPPQEIDYKGQQTNILADLIPQIMNAMGGGDPNTTRILQEQRTASEQKVSAANLRGFMRSVTMPASGEISPELLMQQAELWKIPPDVAMQVIQQFQAFRQQKRGAQTTAFKDVPAQLGSPEIPASLDNLTGLPTSEATPAIPGRPAGTISRSVYENDPLPEGFTTDKFTPIPKDPGYSLSPGQSRFDSTGKPVASLPANPKEQGTIKVPDGKGGWKIIPKMVGATGMENPTNPAEVKPMTPDQAKK